MINNRPRNVSRYPGPVPDHVLQGGDRRIENGPIYPLDEVIELARAKRVKAWSRGAVADARKWRLDEADLAELLELAVAGGRFQNSEWCEARNGGPWAACDAYTVDRIEWIDTAGKHMPIRYYLKAATSSAGEVMLFAANHPEGT